MFSIISGIIFALLSVIWKTSDWINAFIKVSFVTMSVWALAINWSLIMGLVN